MNKNTLDNPAPVGTCSHQTRRGFLFAGVVLLGVVLLAGCGTKRVTTSLPGPIWTGAQPITTPDESGVLPKPTISIGAISRSRWAKGPPIPKNMKIMQPVKYITIHHDGMTLFTTTSLPLAEARLEKIRKDHLQRNGGRWGDIGYHFAIDPAGRLWEGRSLRWQGAHVLASNEGNIGVVVLGNYNRQILNRAQSLRIESTIRWLMKKYNVPVSRVKTHKEWAATDCPGKSLQRLMVSLRRSSLK
ncbi:MAG TPA: N-acetylmuramoyl-L-alanine amidase [Phycisphaerales bacterium]|nr:N-acetylmuramoyl-L-alanine amidase [Phycisphaerales bacterium]